MLLKMIMLPMRERQMATAARLLVDQHEQDELAQGRARWPLEASLPAELELEPRRGVVETSWRRWRAATPSAGDARELGGPSPRASRCFRPEVMQSCDDGTSAKEREGRPARELRRAPLIRRTPSELGDQDEVDEVGGPALARGPRRGGQAQLD